MLEVGLYALTVFVGIFVLVALIAAVIFRLLFSRHH